MARTYYITFDHKAYSVQGMEAAYSAFREACNLAMLLEFHPVVYLSDGETGEILAGNMEEV